MMRSPRVPGIVLALASVVISCSGSPGSPSSPMAVVKDWPNEPDGMRVVTDWGFDAPAPTEGDVPIPGGGGWNVVYELLAGPAHGWVEQGSDSRAPFSPPGVYDFVYPQGMVEGNAPATVYYPVATREVYVGFVWKPSAPFDLGPNGNKIAFIFNGGGDTGGQQFMMFYPDQKLHVLPEYRGDFHWRDPNVNATTVTLGAWHKIEWYSNLNTATMKFWLDGVLQGSHSDVKNPYDFNMFQLSPTWGGNTGARKRETDHYWYDHVHVSVR
jgi:hypothetical protein